MKKIDVWLTILSILFVINLALLIFSWVSTSVLLQPSATTQSEVTVGSFYSISDRFPNGIIFQAVTNAPLTDNPAVDNNDGVSPTLYGIDVIDASVDVEFCIRADRVLTDDGSLNTLGVLADETYLSSQTNDANTPGPPSAGIGLTTADVLMSGGAVPNDGTLWMRFHHDVPADAQSGTYTNTVTFTAQEAGSGAVC